MFAQGDESQTYNICILSKLPLGHFSPPSATSKG